MPVPHGDAVGLAGVNLGLGPSQDIRDRAADPLRQEREVVGRQPPRVQGVAQRGGITCVDAGTGAEVARQRLGSSFYASPVLIKGKLYLVDRYDGTYVLEATPKLTRVALNKLSDDSDFSGSPAVSDGQLFLRSDKFLYCIAAE